MADVRDLLVRIKGDTGDFERSMGKMKGQTDGGQMSFLKLSGAVAAGQAIFAAGAAATRFLGDQIRSSTQAANEAEKAQKQLEYAVMQVSKASQADLQATMQLSDALERKGVLDGDNIKMGLAQLSTFGLSNKAVRSLGGSLSDLAVNQFGVKASGDQLSQTANMIAKALNGQFGVLEKSGIRFTEAQKSIIKYGSEMDKVKAINEGFAQNLKFTNETALATTEGKMAALSVQFENAKEVIGSTLVNAVTPLAMKLADFVKSDGFQQWIQNVGNFITTYLKPAFEWIVNVAFPTLVEWGKQTADLAMKVYNFLKPSLDALFNTIQKDLMPALEKLWKEVIQPLAPVIGAILVVAIWVLINALNVVIKVLSWVIGTLADFLGWAGRTAVGVVNWFKGIPGGISSAFGSLWGVITSPFKTAFNAVADFWNGTVGKLEFKAPDWVPGFGGKGFSMPKLPKLAEGGIVDKATIAMIGEGSEPEAVIPLSKFPEMAQKVGVGGGGAPVNIKLEINVGMYAGMPVEKREIALELWKELVRAARSQGVQLPMIGAVGVQ